MDSLGLPVIFRSKEFKSGEWHEFRILVEGNRHRHWINGHPTADLIDLHEEGRKMEGVLAMQVHKGPPMTVEFKEMRIKHLPDNIIFSYFQTVSSLLVQEVSVLRVNCPKIGSLQFSINSKCFSLGKLGFLFFYSSIVLGLGIRRHFKFNL